MIAGSAPGVNGLLRLFPSLSLARLVRLLELMAQLAQQPDELEQGFHHECIYSIPKFCEPVKHWTLLFLACFSRSDAFLRPQLSHLEAVQQVGIWS